MNLGRQLALGVAMVLFLSTSLFAQGAFPGSGLLGPNGRAIVDSNGTGPDIGDPEIWPAWNNRGAGTATLISDCEGQIVGTESGSGPSGIFDEFGVDGQLFPLLVSGFSDGAPVEVSFDDGTTAGTMTLEPGFGGVYDSIVIDSNKFGQFVFPLMTVDVDFDGKPDYVNAGPLGAFGLEDCSPFSPEDPVNIPIGELPECDLPDGSRTVILDLDGDGSLDDEFLCGPVLWSALATPAVGNVGLLALSLLLVAASLYTLRILG
jgi:hypothetical protein